ncbi:unnamed protein product [Dibothriocephalus latus]|uniref:Myosin tail domain-containing protein n=1 Tax=Dibothriocephalus latus TaxID=60516 RepID=A0A3P7LFR4_DIBLA|nr:unnamed protein product [Dibothriocephalus latus]
MREKMAELEKEGGKRLKLQVTALEGRLAATEEQLEVETPNALFTRTRHDVFLRKGYFAWGPPNACTSRHFPGERLGQSPQIGYGNGNILQILNTDADTATELDEEKLSSTQMKEQVEKAQSAAKRFKGAMESMEDEINQLKSQRRRLQRDLEEITEQKETSERELLTLRSKINRLSYRPLDNYTGDSDQELSPFDIYNFRTGRMGSTGASRPSTRTGGDNTPDDAQSTADTSAPGSDPNASVTTPNSNHTAAE